MEIESKLGKNGILWVRDIMTGENKFIPGPILEYIRVKEGIDYSYYLKFISYSGQEHVGYYKIIDNLTGSISRVLSPDDSF